MKMIINEDLLMLHRIIQYFGCVFVTVAAPRRTPRCVSSQLMTSQWISLLLRLPILGRRSAHILH